MRGQTRLERGERRQVDIQILGGLESDDRQLRIPGDQATSDGPDARAHLEDATFQI